MHAGRAQAGRERGFEHIARKARVLAYDNPVLVIAAPEADAGRQAKPEGRINSHGPLVYSAAHSIRAK